MSASHEPQRSPFGRLKGACAARRVALVLCGVMLVVVPANGRGLWEKTRSSSWVRERDVLGAVERVLMGLGSEHDVLTAEAALVDYTRGKVFEDVRIEILLVRLRLEARWTYDARLEKRLARTLQRPGPAEALGRGWLDWAALGALRGDAAAAEARFESALALVWQPGPRAEGLLGRGYAHMALGRARAAASDFELASRTADTTRLVSAALWSLALAEARSGRPTVAERAGRSAFELEQRRARASGRDVFAGVARVPAYEVEAHAALHAEIEGLLATEAGDEDAAENARFRACESSRRYLLRAEPDGAPWVAFARRTWLACAKPALPR